MGRNPPYAVVQLENDAIDAKKKRRDARIMEALSALTESERSIVEEHGEWFGLNVTIRIEPGYAPIHAIVDTTPVCTPKILFWCVRGWFRTRRYWTLGEALLAAKPRW